MCGIVYSKSFTGRGVIPTIVQRYQNQKHRGSDGFGFYVPKRNKLTHNTKEGRILSLLKREDDEEILFHHRFPTSTANVRNGCHPYSTKDYFENNYVVVHNGVLRNDGELRKAHEELGIKYVSLQGNGRFNDSEALAFDIARYLEGEKPRIEAKGSIAFIAIKRDKGGKPVTLFFARNSGSPLRMKKTKYSLTLSSEGEGEVLETNTLFSMSYDTLEITKRPCVIETGWVQRVNYSNYSPRTYTPQTSFAPTTSNNSCYPFDDGDDELGGVTPNWNTSDDEEYRTVWESEVKSVKEDLEFEAQYDTNVAINLGEIQLTKLQARQTELDCRSLGDDDKSITEEDINEYCGNEDKVRYLEEAIILLRRQLAREAMQTKEDSGRKPIGFQPQPSTTPPPTKVETGVRHAVKQLGTGNTYTD